MSRRKELFSIWPLLIRLSPAYSILGLVLISPILLTAQTVTSALVDYPNGTITISGSGFGNFKAASGVVLGTVKLDEVKIYNRALSAAEVRTLGFAPGAYLPH